MYADNEDTDDMKLKIKVFNGKFQNVTQSLKLTFDNDEFAASRLRESAGLEEMDSAVIFTVKCLPNVVDSDLTDFSDFLKVLVKLSGILEEQDAPISAINPSIVDGTNYGEKLFRITCPLTPELSGMSAGVIQAAGVNRVELELKADEVNKSGYFSVDLDISRNCIELAEEMAGLPPELGSFAKMYNEADMTFKFRSWEHLAENPIIGEIIPAEFAEECKAVLSGAGVEQLLKKITAAVLDQLVVNEPNGTFGPFFLKAMNCFQEVEGVQFIVANSIFKCDVYAPNLVQLCNVPVPKIDDDEQEEFDPSNFPTPFTAPLHEHELTLQNNLYGGMGFACEKCQEYGKGYAYHCELCQYDLHPKCALDI